MLVIGGLESPIEVRELAEYPSHGGSQGFKSPHLHPQHCRSERRQRRAGGAHLMLGPRWAANAPGRVLDVGWERLPKLVDRQSNPSLDGSTTCPPGGSSSLLGVQLQSPTGALAERLAQLLACEEPKLGGGRVALP